MSSPYAQHMLNNMLGPIEWQIDPEEDIVTNNEPNHPVRCGITVTLLGKRLVQQRGQYHV